VDSEGNQIKTERPITWEEIREERDRELSETDWWAMSDRTITDAQKNYRTFLRNLPTNYSTPKEAQTAWLAYDMAGL
tara:strand:+ start:1301 stop:1531 length:231 start_codon:yes stop_codon:yes gene_type:complete